MSSSTPVQEWLFLLTNLLNAPVSGSAGEPIGRLRDVVVAMGAEPFPSAKGLVVSLGGRGAPFYVPWPVVGQFAPRGIRLTTSHLDLRPFERRDGEVLLAKDVLDKQIVDVAGRRVVRANDAQLALAEDALRLVGVDVSAAGFIARLLSPRLIPPALHREIIPWSQVEFFASSVPEVRLTIPHDKIARLHPADIAQLVSELAYPQANEILSALAEPVAADTVESLDPARQAAILSSMDEEEAADILEEMDPDDAADALADLTPQQARDLLEEMDAEDAAAVEELLTYPEHSAGGIMTTDYVAIPQQLTAAEAIRRLRGFPELPGPLYYLYVLDNEVDGRLVGVVTLRDLLTAAPETPVSQFMASNVITGKLTDDAEEVARAIAHYNLLAIPIVDPSARLRGIVTIDDAMDIILPKEWKRRLPKIFG